MTFKQLLLMAMTSGAIGIAFVTLSPIIASFSSMIPWEKFGRELSYIFQTVYLIVLFIIVLMLSLSYIVGTFLVLIKY